LLTFFSFYRHIRSLHSFPTRRSSDQHHRGLVFDADSRYPCLHRQHPQRLELGEAMDDLLAQALAEIFEIVRRALIGQRVDGDGVDRKSTRLNSSHVEISYAVFCLKKK